MPINKTPLNAILLFFAFLSSAVYAEFDITKHPVGQKEIPIKELKFRLTPLAQEDLNKTAYYWQQTLEKHLNKVADLQVRIAQEAQENNKAILLEQLKKLNEQSIKIQDRVRLTLSELEKKGGDTKIYQQYLDAVSGPKVDTEDTQALAATISGWLESPEGGIRWLKNIALFFFILILTSLLARIFGSIASRAAQRMKNATELLKHFFENLVRNIIKIIGFIFALSMLEINITPLLAALGATGFIIGFALQGTLSNFASGLMILIYRPYDVGDVIDVAGAKGSVSAMTLVSTTLKLPDNQLVVIPNNAIWGSTITNVTGSTTRRVDMVFGIGYEDDISKAEQILSSILTNHPLILKTPEPVIKLHELADSSVNFIVRPWANTGDYFDVYWDVTRAVKERFDAEGISIPYPQQDVHMHTVTQ